jgi:uncharacterized protein YaaW (UPF0174 family)
MLKNAEVKMKIVDVLKGSQLSDVDVLVDYITDCGEGRVALDDALCAKLYKCRGDKYSNEAIESIAEQISLFGYGVISNRARIVNFAYEDVAKDLAKRFVGHEEEYESVQDVENAILETIFRTSWMRLDMQAQSVLSAEFGSFYSKSPDALIFFMERIEYSDLHNFYLSALIANAVSLSVLGYELHLGDTRTSIQSGLALMLKPVAWTITNFWSSADLAGPGYRVTVPCIIQTAFMRRRLMTSG